MDTRAPFDFHIVGLHFVGWMDIEIDPDRYETKVDHIIIHQIDRMPLPAPLFLDFDEIYKEKQQQIQEYADQWVDDNFHEICREHAEAAKAHIDDDF